MPGARKCERRILKMRGHGEGLVGNGSVDEGERRRGGVKGRYRGGKGWAGGAGAEVECGAERSVPGGGKDTEGRGWWRRCEGVCGVCSERRAGEVCYV